MANKQSPFVGVSYDSVNMTGGMDEMTPLLQLPTGMVRSAMNFESSILGGYARIQGYERYDGRELPSSKVFSIVAIASFVNIPVVGSTITGFSSNATGYVLSVDADHIVISEITGAFSIPEIVKVGATVIGTTTTSVNQLTGLEYATYLSLAADRQRTHIGAVPGTGPVRGVFVYQDKVYAFRDTGAATLLYKESATGWALVPYLYELKFTAGNITPVEGNTITQGGVTAVINRVVLQGGAWLGGSAVGKLVIQAPAGGNFAAGAATTPTSTFTLSGAQTAITFAVGGTFETIQANFSGAGTTLRIYGCDGFNRAWEFDGTTLVPIDTGAAVDTPKHLCAHKNFLFLAIFSALTFSAPGLPYDFTPLDGAGLIAVGDIITNTIELPGAQSTAAMGVWTRNTSFILYGTGASSFNLTPNNTGVGGMHYTAQNMMHTYVVDDRGASDMQETLNYGNFTIDTITYRVNNFFNAHRKDTVAASLNRIKSQYRIFFSNGFGLYITNLHGQYAGMNIASGSMPVYFPNPVYCIEETKLSTGSEVTYFGSTSGYVYLLDSGSSFDGAAISANLTFGYNSIGSPRILKRFRHVQVEVQGTSYSQFSFGYSLGYGAASIQQPLNKLYINDTNVPYWDAFTWDAFTWDGLSVLPIEVEMNGTAQNYALSFTSSSNMFYPFTIASAITHYTPRRPMR